MNYTVYSSTKKYRKYAIASFMLYSDAEDFIKLVLINKFKYWIEEN